MRDRITLIKHVGEHLRIPVHPVAVGFKSIFLSGVQLTFTRHIVCYFHRLACPLCKQSHHRNVHHSITLLLK